jgi:TetR/AcrR family transcriptional repressor of nem operon
VFWQQGYTATSMSQLLDVTGMGSGSFYAAFDNKASLFQRIVDDYTCRSMGEFARIRESHRGLAALRVFLDKTLIDVSDTDRRKGCLLVNSALELDEVEPQLYQHVADGLRRLELTIRGCVEETAAAGRLRKGLSIGDAVGLLMGLVQGLRVESRLGLSRREARRRVDVMLNLIANETARES